MAELPVNIVTQEDLAKWFLLVAEKKRITNDEMLLRNKIFGFYFKDAKEGTNSFTLPDGYVLKGTRKIDRKLDEPILLNMWDAFIAQGINPNELVRRKPELAVTEFKQLTAEQQHFFSQALIIKDGSPTLEITPPTKKRTAAPRA